MITAATISAVRASADIVAIVAETVPSLHRHGQLWGRPVSVPR